MDLAPDQILLLDRSLVVVNKPAGLATVLHPEDRKRLPSAAWPPTLERLLPPLIRRMEGAGAKGAPRPLRVIQRLDAGTSGVLVFARTPEAEQALADQFRRHRVHRRYLALVRGTLAAPIRLDTLLVDNRGDGLRGSLQPGTPSSLQRHAKRAITHVTPLETLPGHTLVECRLETGRTHQIRIHLAEAGHPLLGEPVYQGPYRPARKDSRAAPRRKGKHARPTPATEIEAPATRLMLHAHELGFDHPGSGKPLRFTQPPPAAFQAVLAMLRGGG